MGGVPKRHKTRSKVRMRRSQQKLKKTILVLCPHCKRLILPHRVCPFCGYYKGRQVIKVKEKTKKKKK